MFNSAQRLLVAKGILGAQKTAADELRWFVTTWKEKIMYSHKYDTMLDIHCVGVLGCQSRIP